MSPTGRKLIEEGLIEGKKEGRKEEKKDIAKNLLDILDDETISLKTGLTLDEVIEIRRISNK